MATTGCTDETRYGGDNTSAIPVDINNPATKYNIPNPTWTEGDDSSVDAKQCGSITLGGFDGLNS